MGRTKKNKILDLYLNGLLVGKLNKQPSGLISFRYENNWLDEGMAISQSMPLQEDEYRGEIVARYFDNLLPDNEEIKKLVATKFGAESTKSFDLLSAIGMDCVGALSFLPEGQEPGDITKTDYSQLTPKEIAKTLRGLGRATPLGMSEDEDFRLSIAGAQEKTAFLSVNGKWCKPHGMTPTTHIFKTSIGALGDDTNFDDSVDNEWTSLKILEKFGLPVCEAKIGEFEDQRALIVKRFDRRWEKLKGKNFLLRVPQEDMCQALGISPYKKYQSDGGPGISDIAKLLRSSLNEVDRENFFKAILIFDLLYATDGHAKNFSLFIQKDGIRLTPFYDVMSAYFLHRREKRALQKFKLAMKVGESGHYDFKRINLKHYRETASQCGFSQDKFDQIYEDIKSSYSKLSFNKKELGAQINHETVSLILEGIEKRAKKLF
ncbi:MAG: hypothetical protein CME65_05370 [Halobacteriovoraceae bacterium]|nr:hypothetical protein [Halobacteriovoraceae bacterium]|tara:strand:- start:15305 stop:16603 length:1299 start_codon:yes stop_codon:yes gene_type:complete